MAAAVVVVGMFVIVVMMLVVMVMMMVMTAESVIFVNMHISSSFIDIFYIILGEGQSVKTFIFTEITPRRACGKMENRV